MPAKPVPIAVIAHERSCLFRVFRLKWSCVWHTLTMQVYASA